MAKSSFKEKLSFSFRKFIISLKRNYYVIPLGLVFICCIQFMCSLHVLSPVFDRIPQAYGQYNCLFIFVISLFTILFSVAYLNYALVKYGQKRPVFMLIIYLVMWAITMYLLFKVLKANSLNLAEEYRDYNAATSESKRNEYLKYIVLGEKTASLLITQIVLEFISVVGVLTAPIVQNAFKKITFKPIENNSSNATEEATYEEKQE